MKLQLVSNSLGYYDSSNTSQVLEPRALALEDVEFLHDIGGHFDMPNSYLEWKCSAWASPIDAKPTAQQYADWENSQDWHDFVENPEKEWVTLPTSKLRECFPRFPFPEKEWMTLYEALQCLEGKLDMYLLRLAIWLIVYGREDVPSLIEECIKEGNTEWEDTEWEDYEFSYEDDLEFVSKSFMNN